MVITALLYQESWPLWPTSLFMGLSLLAMTVGIVRQKRADQRRP